MVFSMYFYYFFFFFVFVVDYFYFFFFFFQAEDGIRDRDVTGVQTCALPICSEPAYQSRDRLQGARGQRGAPRRPPLRSSLRPGRAAAPRRATALARVRAGAPARGGAGIRCDGRSGGLPRRETPSADVARPRSRGAGPVGPGADATGPCIPAGDRRSTSATRGPPAADRSWRGRGPHRRADLAAASFVGGR